METEREEIDETTGSKFKKVISEAWIILNFRKDEGAVGERIPVAHRKHSSIHLMTLWH